MAQWLENALTILSEDMAVKPVKLSLPFQLVGVHKELFKNKTFIYVIGCIAVVGITSGCGKKLTCING